VIRQRPDQPEQAVDANIGGETTDEIALLLQARDRASTELLFVIHLARHPTRALRTTATPANQLRRVLETVTLVLELARNRHQVDHTVTGPLNSAGDAG